MPMGLRFRVVTPRVRLEVNGVACSRSCPRALLEANVRDERKCLSNRHDYSFKLVIRRTARRCSVRSKHPDIILAFSFLARMKRKHSDINRLRAKLPFVSQRALVAVLDELRRQPIPDVASTRDPWGGVVRHASVTITVM